MCVCVSDWWKGRREIGQKLPNRDDRKRERDAALSGRRNGEIEPMKRRGKEGNEEEEEEKWRNRVR